jgi:uncharacterized protein (DUF433 family)
VEKVQPFYTGGKNEMENKMRLLQATPSNKKTFPKPKGTPKKKKQPKRSNVRLNKNIHTEPIGSLKINPKFGTTKLKHKNNSPARPTGYTQPLTNEEKMLRRERIARFGATATTSVPVRGPRMIRSEILPLLEVRAETIKQQGKQLPPVTTNKAMCGGEPCVDGTRVRVDYLAKVWLSGQESVNNVLLERERGITQEYFDAAILYVAQNPDTIKWASS